MNRDPNPPVNANPPGSIVPRVLVVDDEETVLDVFREYLASEGYDVTPASSGWNGPR